MSKCFIVLALGLAVAGAGTQASTQNSAAAKAKPTATPTSTVVYSVTDLGSLGYGLTYGLAINNNGQVTGGCWQSGTMTDIGAAFYPDELYPTSINDGGVVVGGPFLWSNGRLENLNNLIPPGSGFTLDDATGINDR